MKIITYDVITLAQVGSAVFSYPHILNSWSSNIADVPTLVFSLGIYSFMHFFLNSIVASERSKWVTSWETRYLLENTWDSLENTNNFCLLNSRTRSHGMNGIGINYLKVEGFFKAFIQTPPFPWWQKESKKEQQKSLKRVIG